MNYASKFGLDNPFEFGSFVNVKSVTLHGGGDTITIPDAHLLFTGDYKRSGVDLILSNDGHELVVHDYFKGEKRASLASPDGAHLTGDIVNALVGHVEYAQAAVAPDSAKVIGHVTKITGNATALRNGVSIVLNVGDNVNKGDVVQSGSDSTLGITFVDGTVFGLASNARMVLNEMVYDPNGSNNSSLLSLVQGTMTFVAGETAKHGDMKIDTPVATLGIRGTAVLVEIDFTVAGQGNAPPVNVQLLAEPDGHIGEFLLYSKPTDGTAPVQIGIVSAIGQSYAVSFNGNVTQQAAPAQTQQAAAIIQQVFIEKFQAPPPASPAPPPTDNNNNPDTKSPPAGGGGSSTPPPAATPLDTSPIKVAPPATLPPPAIPISNPAPATPPSGPNTLNTQSAATGGAPIVIKTIDITPVVDKQSFVIADQVKITDSNPNDAIVPYVPGSATIASTSPNFPPNIDVSKFITIDAQTGTISYDPASLKLPAGTSVFVVIGFQSTAGNETFRATLPLTIDAVGGAPPAVSISTQGGDTHTPAQTISGTVTAGDSGVGATVTLLDNGTPIATVPVDNAGNWTASVTLSNTSGTHSIVAQDTDTAATPGLVPR